VRRQFERNDVQAVIKVFTEVAELGQCLQVAVRRGDQADVDLLRLGRADSPDLAFLQYAQQPGLGFQRQFADLVEKQRATVRGLHQPGAAGTGAGEGAFLVSEELGFDQRLGDRCAVDGNHRRLGALRKIVQGAGDQFLAGTGLTLDEHIGVGRRHLADLAEQILHGRAVADDADLSVGCVLRCGPWLAGTALRRGAASLLAVAQDARDGLQHFIVVEGLGDVVHGAHLHRVDGRAQARITGHDQHRYACGQLDQLGSGGAG